MPRRHRPVVPPRTIDEQAYDYAVSSGQRSRSPNSQHAHAVRAVTFTRTPESYRTIDPARINYTRLPRACCPACCASPHPNEHLYCTPCAASPGCPNRPALPTSPRARATEERRRETARHGMEAVRALNAHEAFLLSQPNQLTPAASRARWQAWQATPREDAARMASERYDQRAGTGSRSGGGGVVVKTEHGASAAAAGRAGSRSGSVVVKTEDGAGATSSSSSSSRRGNATGTARKKIKSEPED